MRRDYTPSGRSSRLFSSIFVASVVVGEDTAVRDQEHAESCLLLFDGDCPDPLIDASFLFSGSA